MWNSACHFAENVSKRVETSGLNVFFYQKNIYCMYCSQNILYINWNSLHMIQGLNSTFLYMCQYIPLGPNMFLQFCDKFPIPSSNTFFLILTSSAKVQHLYLLDHPPAVVFVLSAWNTIPKQPCVFFTSGVAKPSTVTNMNIPIG